MSFVASLSSRGLPTVGEARDEKGGALASQSIKIALRRTATMPEVA
jgi:hypothetical protein